MNKLKFKSILDKVQGKLGLLIKERGKITMKKYFLVIFCLIQITLYSQTTNCRVVFLIGDQRNADYIVNYEGTFYELHTENKRGHFTSAINISIPDTTEKCSILPFQIFRKGCFKRVISCEMEVRYYGKFPYLIVTQDFTRKRKYRFKSFWLIDPFLTGTDERVWSYEDKEFLLKEIEALW